MMCTLQKLFGNRDNYEILSETDVPYTFEELSLTTRRHVEEVNVVDDEVHIVYVDVHQGIKLMFRLQTKGVPEELLHGEYVEVMDGHVAGVHMYYLVYINITDSMFNSGSKMYRLVFSIDGSQINKDELRNVKISYD